MKVKTSRQTARIIRYMESGKSITPLQALNLFGCLRLSARIFDIREMGYKIKSEPYKTSEGKTVSKYSLIS